MIGRQPGWDLHSYGYHGDDGAKFCSTGRGTPYGPVFSAGDTVGCGIDFFAGYIFFTCNGQFLGPAFRTVVDLPLYPVIGCGSTCPLVANFGARPFVFDVRAFERAVWKSRPWDIHDILQLQGDLSPYSYYLSQKKPPKPFRAFSCSECGGLRTGAQSDSKQHFRMNALSQFFSKTKRMIVALFLTVVRVFGQYGLMELTGMEHFVSSIITVLNPAPITGPTSVASWRWNSLFPVQRTFCHCRNSDSTMEPFNWADPQVPGIATPLHSGWLDHRRLIPVLALTVVLTFAITYSGRL